MNEERAGLLLQQKKHIRDPIAFLLTAIIYQRNHDRQISNLSWRQQVTFR